MSQPVKGLAAEELVRVTVGSVGYWVRRPRPQSGLNARSAAKFKDLNQASGARKVDGGYRARHFKGRLRDLERGGAYKDCAVDYAALMVKKNAARWIRSLKKFNLIINLG
jgi:hypothetical protein